MPEERLPQALCMCLSAGKGFKGRTMSCPLGLKAGTWERAFTTSMPSSTCPNTRLPPSSLGTGPGPVVMMNCRLV